MLGLCALNFCSWAFLIIDYNIFLLKHIRDGRFYMDISGAPEKKSVVAKRMIADVTEALKTQTAAQVSSGFADYQKEFPTLFAILLRPNYRADLLSMMLSQLEKIESGQTSQHDASVSVGTVLVDQLVKPQITPSSQ